MSLPAQDGILDVATGLSRKETSWKNKEISWSELVSKLKTTHRTTETHSQYITLGQSREGRERQDEIKDIGGFVGGYINNGRRKAANILHRQLITLDIDFAPADFWDDFTLLYGNAAVLYSTHKHSPDSPRLRLILPLNRPVMTDEYQAIARRIAGNLDIEYFDPTTFQAERLMYWPSTSVDGEYLYEVQAGAFINADAVLESYRDWRDTSAWPTSERAQATIAKGIAKQGDPLEKTGLIGAFCRTYDIHQVIESFLADRYTATSDPNRYTYVDGSTSGGLVVYDDKFAFSHHSTDPISMKLCNAFDLVRLHKFTDLDEDSKPDTPINRLPSFLAMQDFAAADNDTKLLLGRERLESAKYDFAGLDEDEIEDIAEADKDWTKELDVDKHGGPENTIKNVILILANDPVLKGCILFNDFEKREVAKKNLPWRRVTESNRDLTEADDAALREYLETIYGITSANKIKDGYAVHLQNNKFHPVREYLKALQWDGVKRVDRLLIDYLGAEDDALNRAFIRKMLAGAVARVFWPGIKFDTALVLVGDQGPGKSTFIEKLGGIWFSDSFGSLKTNAAFESLQGTWIMEIGELAGLRKAEVDEIKQFMSKKVDNFRPAYAKRTEKFPRQCVFFGTTNNFDFLQDLTGNRRFWPVKVDRARAYKDVFTMPMEEVNQVWAEAQLIYQAGELLYLTADMEAQAVARQEEHTEQYPHAGAISEYLERLYPDNWNTMDHDLRQDFLNEGLRAGPGAARKTQFCVAEIWVDVLGNRKAEMTRYNTRELLAYLRSLKEWIYTGKSARFPEPFGVQKGFERRK